MDQAEAVQHGHAEIAAGQLRLIDSQGESAFEAQLHEAAFPDLSHAIPAVRDSALVSVEALAKLIGGHSATELWSLRRSSVDYRGSGLVLGAGPATEESPEAIYVNRVYLQEAVVGLAGGRGTGQLRFDFDGPTDPVAIRRADELGTFAVVLPVIPGQTR